MRLPFISLRLKKTFDVIKRVHLLTGRGGRDKMVKEVNKKYANVTQESLSLFKSLCVECHRKRKRPTTKGTVVRPIVSKDFNSRGQADLIDMQSMKQGEFRWIMVYQDHLTKFCVLRPLTSKRAAEVAYQLLDIFLLLGAPCILQSDNGSEFTAQIIVELKELWPDLVLVHGKPRHPQSQGSVERANCDIKDMLVAWLGDNDTTDWTIGLKFVQFQKNASHHSGIKCPPFAALLCADAKMGLTSSSLPHEVLSKLQSEDDLLARVCQETTPKNDNSAPVSSPSEISLQEPNEITTTTSHPSSVPGERFPTTSESSSEVHILSDTSSTDTTSADIASSQQAIKISRKRANEAQQQQAERMVKRSKRIMTTVKVGDNVTVPVPNVDRGRADPRNLIGVVLDISDADMYTIAVKGGNSEWKVFGKTNLICVQPLFIHIMM